MFIGSRILNVGAPKECHVSRCRTHLFGSLHSSFRTTHGTPPERQ